MGEKIPLCVTLSSLTYETEPFICVLISLSQININIISKVEWIQRLIYVWLSKLMNKWLIFGYRIRRLLNPTSMIHWQFKFVLFTKMQKLVFSMQCISSTELATNLTAYEINGHFKWCIEKFVCGLCQTHSLRTDKFKEVRCDFLNSMSFFLFLSESAFLLLLSCMVWHQTTFIHRMLLACFVVQLIMQLSYGMYIDNNGLWVMHENYNNCAFVVRLMARVSVYRTMYCRPDWVYFDYFITIDDFFPCFACIL